MRLSDLAGSAVGYLRGVRASTCGDTRLAATALDANVLALLVAREVGVVGYLRGVHASTCGDTRLAATALVANVLALLVAREVGVVLQHLWCNHTLAPVVLGTA